MGLGVKIIQELKEKASIERVTVPVHSLANLEASVEPADLLTTPSEVESSRQYTDPAFYNRPTSRTVFLRPTRKAREKPKVPDHLRPLDIRACVLSI